MGVWKNCVYSYYLLLLLPSFIFVLWLVLVIEVEMVDDTVRPWVREILYQELGGGVGPSFLL